MVSERALSIYSSVLITQMEKQFNQKHLDTIHIQAELFSKCNHARRAPDERPTGALRVLSARRALKNTHFFKENAHFRRKKASA